jgi:hypothetical protein
MYIDFYERHNYQHFQVLARENNQTTLVCCKKKKWLEIKPVRVTVYCSAKAVGLGVFNRNGLKPIPIDVRVVLALAK